MKRILVYVLLIFCGFGYSQGNSFIKVYGNSGYDYGRDIQQDNDTGYVITGSSSSFVTESGDAFILKLDLNGDFVWSHNYGGTDSDWGEAIVVTSDSTYALAGYTNSFGSGGFDFYLVRAAVDGSLIWQKTFGGSNWDKAYGLIQLPDSGFVLVGESSSYSSNDYDAYALRTDKNGDTLWTKLFNYATSSFFRDVTIDGDSLIICGGIGDGGINTFDGLIIKMGIDGNMGWQKIVGQGNNDFFNATEHADTLYYFGGVRSYNYANEKEDLWMYAIKQDGSLWIDTTFVNATPENDGVNDIDVRVNIQELEYAGYTSSYGFLMDGLPDFFFGKMAYNGFQYTATNYGEAGDDIAYGIDVTYDQAIVTVGDTKFFSTGGHNILVVKIDPSWTYPDLWAELTYNDITTSIFNYEQENTDFSIYPNPFNDIIYLAPDFKESEFEIRDLSGKIILTGQVEETSLDLSSLSAGSYIMRLELNENTYQSRIIKM